MLLPPRPWRRLGFPLLALSLWARSTAHADDRAVDTFTPSPDQLGFTNFASTRTPGHLGVDATVWFDYARNLGATPYTWYRDIDHRFSATAIAQLGLWSRAAVAVHVPFVLYQVGQARVPAPFQEPLPEAPAVPPSSEVELDRQAVGNPAIDTRVRLFGAGVRPDGSVADGGAFALRGVFHVPVGTSNNLFADDRFRMDLSAIGDLQLFGISAGAAFSYRFRAPDEANVVTTPRGDRFTALAGPLVESGPSHVLRLAVGLRVPLPLLSRAFPGRVQEAGLVELDFQTPKMHFFKREHTPVEGRLGYRAIVGDIFTTLTFGAGFTEAFGAPDFRTTLAVGWSPRQHDQDADGVPDGSDQCVHLPEDRDGYLDEDGCADDDNDGDLIVDEDDRCPMQPAEMDRDDDEDGCTDT